MTLKAFAVTLANSLISRGIDKETAVSTVLRITRSITEEDKAEIGAYQSADDFSELSDEIMRTVAQKGIGMEINTSGIDRVFEPLPSIDYIKRFRELGGEIITVGSDAHDSTRVGQHIDKALDIAREVFGYVCTFEGRKPIFHKL